MSQRAVITQGEHLVSADPQLTISTLLGSCVACCLWDAEMSVGGMNHMLLTQSQGTAHAFAGVNAMELLINDLLKLGARRSHLQAKAFGGAQMVSGLSDIGPANCAFILGFLEGEGITCVSQSLGGTTARHVLFRPTLGTVKMKMQKHATLNELVAPTPKPAIGNDLELF